MKTKLLRKIRKQVAKDYSVTCVGDKWYVVNQGIISGYKIFSSKEAVIAYMTSLWHIRAEQILVNKKRRIYIW